MIRHVFVMKMQMIWNVVERLQGREILRQVWNNYLPEMFGIEQSFEMIFSYVPEMH